MSIPTKRPPRIRGIICFYIPRLLSPNNSYLFSIVRFERATRTSETKNLNFKILKIVTIALDVVHVKRTRFRRVMKNTGRQNEKKKLSNNKKRTQRGLRYAERVELGQPVALGRRHGRHPAADAVPLLPRPAFVRRRPVLLVLVLVLVPVTGHPGRAAHGRFQVAAAARVPVLEPLVVGTAEHGPVPDAVVVALAQHRAARVTRETLHVIHELLGPHHQVAGADAALAPGAPLHREQSAGETKSAVRRRVPADRVRSTDTGVLPSML